MISILKTGTYYFMHMLVVMGITYAVTRDWHVATTISLLEPVVQTLFFSLHDLAWRRRARLSWVPVKTATYYVMHVLVTMGLTYVLTRDWQTAATISMLEPVVQTVFFSLHELVWQGRLRPLLAPCCGGHAADTP